MCFGPDCLKLHELAADQGQEYLDANESYFLLPISSPEASEFLPLPECGYFRERHSCGLQEAASVSTQAFLAIKHDLNAYTAQQVDVRKHTCSTTVKSALHVNLWLYLRDSLADELRQELRQERSHALDGSKGDCTSYHSNFS